VSLSRCIACGPWYLLTKDNSSSIGHDLSLAVASDLVSVSFAALGGLFSPFAEDNQEIIKGLDVLGCNHQLPADLRYVFCVSVTSKFMQQLQSDRICPLKVSVAYQRICFIYVNRVLYVHVKDFCLYAYREPLLYMHTHAYTDESACTSLSNTCCLDSQIESFVFGRGRLVGDEQRSSVCKYLNRWYVLHF